jgi:hypothetical protein
MRRSSEGALSRMSVSFLMIGIDLLHCLRCQSIHAYRRVAGPVCSLACVRLCAYQRQENDDGNVDPVHNGTFSYAYYHAVIMEGGRNDLA